MRLPHSFILLVLAALANSSITNTTVDDTSSSFTFDGAWSAITPTSPCDICSSKPDPSQTQGGTWHDGNCRTGAPTTTTGSFTFQGSAIYIFGIDQAISQPNIVFTLGNVQQTHHYTGTESFAYHALFFSATGLAADQMHTVNWVFNVDDSTGVEVQAALFDYAVVTSGEEDAAPTPTPTAKSPTTTTTSRPTTSAKTSIRSSTRFSAGAHPVSSSSQAPVS
ncbi:hypothetical protein FB451DRAFT_159546 [Mycena latifolia]|nr:hypothetical protein FB451DRAFT_159546 [Mycena latifolia]